MVSETREVIVETTKEQFVENLQLEGTWELMSSQWVEEEGRKAMTAHRNL